MNLVIIALVLVQATLSPREAYAPYNQFTEFDRHFSKYSKRYFGPAFDWRYFKAQAIAESRLQVALSETVHPSPSDPARRRSRPLTDYNPRTSPEPRRIVPLTPGVRLGAYEVTAKIGSGGMGEVYQALDTNLDRDVALKVLPDAFTSDPDRLARFEREAKVLAR